MNIYTPEKFRFRHTHTQRTEASYKAFVEGLFGEGASEHVQVAPKTSPDLLLKVNCRTYFNFKKLKNEIFLSHSSHAEHIRTTKPDKMVQTLKVLNLKIVKRINRPYTKFPQDWDLNSHSHPNKSKRFGTCADLI